MVEMRRAAGSVRRHCLGLAAEFFRYRSRSLLLAVWTWWLVMGAWEAAAPGLQAVGLVFALGFVFLLQRGSPWWPDNPIERGLSTSLPFLVLNTFLWRRCGLTPRLSFLTALPLVWTLAFLLGKGFHFTAKPRHGLIDRVERMRYGMVAILLAVFTGWFSTGATLRWQGMVANYWDLGSIGQAMANMARGRGFVSTDPAGFSDSRFAQHFEPLFVLLSPLMIYSHGVAAMFILQSLCVFLAAVFTGLAVERILDRREGFWIGMAGVCLHPAAGYPLWFDFHGDVFAMLPISIMLWAMAGRRWKLFWTAFVAAGACIEFSLVATSGIALMMIQQGWATDKDVESRRHGLLLLSISAVAFCLILFGVMPYFRSPGAPSVLANHLGIFRGTDWKGPTVAFLPSGSKVLETVLNRFNLANLFQVLIPLSGGFFLAPVALLGALPNVAKDMIFGFDLSNHHFAPAVPLLFIGLALAIRNSLPDRFRSEALLQAGLCATIAAILWGPSPLGSSGWKNMLAMPSLGDKVHQLVAQADPNRPRLLTGNLGGVLFDSPVLYFLGSTSVAESAYAHLVDPDVFLELWDVGFYGWAPFGRMQDQLERFLEGRPVGVWMEIASGTLRRMGDGVPGELPDGEVLVELCETDAPKPESKSVEIPLSSFRTMRMLNSARAYAVVAVHPDGTVLPLGIRSPGRKWLFFQVREPQGWNIGSRLQLRDEEFSEGEMSPIRYWPVQEEVPLTP